MCGTFGVAFKLNPHPRHQHCTDEAQKAETVLSAVIYIYIYISSVEATQFFFTDDYELFIHITSQKFRFHE